MLLDLLEFLSSSLTSQTVSGRKGDSETAIRQVCSIGSRILAPCRCMLEDILFSHVT